MSSTSARVLRQKYKLERNARGPGGALAENEIRITSTGSTNIYISYAAKLFQEKSYRNMKLIAAGNVLDVAVTVAEILKRRFKGLHQITKIGATKVVDRYLPLEEGLDEVEQERNISHMEIQLSLDPLDTHDTGYQPPLRDSLVKELPVEDLVGKRKKGDKKGRSDTGFGKKGKSNDPSSSSQDWYNQSWSGGGYQNAYGDRKGSQKGKGKKGEKGTESQSWGYESGKGKKGSKKGQGGKGYNTWDDSTGRKGGFEQSQKGWQSPQPAYGKQYKGAPQAYGGYASHPGYGKDAQKGAPQGSPSQYNPQDRTGKGYSENATVYYNAPPPQWHDEHQWHGAPGASQGFQQSWNPAQSAQPGAPPPGAYALPPPQPGFQYALPPQPHPGFPPQGSENLAAYAPPPLYTTAPPPPMPNQPGIAPPPPPPGQFQQIPGAPPMPPPGGPGFPGMPPPPTGGPNFY